MVQWIFSCFRSGEIRNCRYFRLANFMIILKVHLPPFLKFEIEFHFKRWPGGSYNSNIPLLLAIPAISIHIKQMSCQNQRRGISSPTVFLCMESIVLLMQISSSFYHRNAFRASSVETTQERVQTSKWIFGIEKDTQPLANYYLLYIWLLFLVPLFSR